MTWLVAFVTSILTFAFLIDRKRKKNRNTAQQPINPHEKPGGKQQLPYGR
ncbi:hypothetical protein LC040_03775 [Bacillus tianshenii]|nr:hypothetical protein LC040_03775 [Bacillus tianshenii]